MKHCETCKVVMLDANKYPESPFRICTECAAKIPDPFGDIEDLLKGDA